MVYEDGDIIVIDKPAHLVVHPAAGHWTGTLVNALIAHCGESLSGIGGERRPGIVHRLDKDTTGLMVVAKNDRAHRALAAQFADHHGTAKTDESRFERSYLALVWGAPERPRGTIDAPIDRDKRARDRMAVRAGGRQAVTHWQVLERYRGAASGPAGKAAKATKPAPPVASLARLPAGNRPNPPDSGPSGLDRPSAVGRCGLWGRIPHQIALLPANAQAALAALGRQALHAHILTLKHPSNGKILTFRSELPPDLVRLHNALAGGRAESARRTLAISKDLPISRVFSATCARSMQHRADVMLFPFRSPGSTVYVAGAKSLNWRRRLTKERRPIRLPLPRGHE